VKKLYIEQTDRTPEIKFEYGKLHIWGTFVPVDPAEFYELLMEWVKKYSIAPAPVTVFNIGILYVRGYAMNIIEALLQELVFLNDEEHKVIINWHFSKDSIDLKAGEYLSRKLNYPFNFIEVEDIR
jgi:hypothetical protein